MLWHFVSSIGLLFLYIPQVTVSVDLCSSITHGFSSDSNTFSFLVKDINTTPRNCLCEFTTSRSIAVYLYLSCTCSQCGPNNFCSLDPCFCSSVDLTTTPTCTPTFGNSICQGFNYNPHSCGKSTKFTLGLNLSAKSLTRCSVGQETQNLDLTIRLLVLDDHGKPTDPEFKEVGCNVRSAGSKSDPDKMIIGIVVGVGGAALITAIAIVIVVLRRRRAESNKPHANDASQATPAAGGGTGETAYESYPIPVLTTIAAYDNATIGATSSDQTLAAYDNERVGESINPYAEVEGPEERGNDNGYDNSGIGRNEVYSMYKEVGKDYDNTGVKPSTNIENETTVIDNEFYE